MIPVPNRSVDVVDQAGGVSLAWWRFFSSIYPTSPSPEISITVGASPYAYTAPDRGAVIVSGGTVSAISMKRINSHATGITAGVIPVGRGDILTVTYSVAPTMTFMPT